MDVRSRQRVDAVFAGAIAALVAFALFFISFVHDVPGGPAGTIGFIVDHQFENFALWMLVSGVLALAYLMRAATLPLPMSRSWVWLSAVPLIWGIVVVIRDASAMLLFLPVFVLVLWSSFRASARDLSEEKR